MKKKVISQILGTLVAMALASHAQFQGAGRRSDATLTDHWYRQHPVESGWRLASVSVVDSLHAFAAGRHDSAAGLVVATTNGGQNWIELSRSLPLHVNDIHFVNASTGWIVGGDNIQFSGFVMMTSNRGPNLDHSTQHKPREVLVGVFLGCVAWMGLRG